MPGLAALIDTLTHGLAHEIEPLTALWRAQSPATKGAIAGGLVGLLLSGHARRVALGLAEVGTAALIGRLAMQAYGAWQASGPDLSPRLLRAMVAAACADKVVSAAEHAALTARLAELNLGPQALSLLAEELAAPLDAAAVAALARTPAEAAALYAASLLVIDRSGTAETTYLADLAAALGLTPAQQRHLQGNVSLQA